MRSYRTIVAIAADHDVPQPRPGVIARVYWGDTGCGKSWRAWNEAGPGAYYKDPRSKFWCSYRGEKNIVIDEFRGGIDISHVLRWLDRYPVIADLKGSSRPLCGLSFWFTSNLAPDWWYPEADAQTKMALSRRLLVEEMNTPYTE